MADNRQRSTHWAFTHHVNMGEECEHCTFHPNKVQEVGNKKATYTVLGGACQLEVTKSGGHHWQGWCHFDKEIVFTSLKSLFCNKIHWEKMIGTTEQNMAYCTKVKNKDGSEARVENTEPIVFGDSEARNPHIKRGAGARNDLEEVINLCNEGNTEDDVRALCPAEWIKYHKGIKDYMRFCVPKWVEQPRKFYIFWGENGSGKNWGAEQIIKDDTWFDPDSNNQSHLSFENYDGQKWIVLHEFKGMGLFCDDLKKMTDRYECTLRGRGCTKKGQHLGVIITSQKNPSEWYPSESEEDMNALLRRVTGLWHCTRSHWMNQLTGQMYENPCPYVSQAPPSRSFRELPTVPAHVGSVVTVNGKKRKFEDIFGDKIDLCDSDSYDEEEFTDLR